MRVARWRTTASGPGRTSPTTSARVEAKAAPRRRSGSPTALDVLVEHPQDRILVVSHALPLRYIIDASDGRFPAARIDHVDHAVPYFLAPRGGRPRRRRPCASGPRHRGSSTPTATAPISTSVIWTGCEASQCPRCATSPSSVAAEIARHCYLASGRAGHVPRLRWGRLDLSLARVDAARVRRPCGARPPRRARRSRRIAMPSTASPTLDAEVVRLAGGAPRQSSATVATPRPPRYGLRATGHTASDQVETVLLRLLASGSTRGIRPRARRWRRTAAPDGLARGDAGLLRRARALRRRGRDERRQQARAASVAHPAAARGARSALQGEPVRPRGGASTPPPAARGDAGGAALDPRGHGTGRSGWRASCASGSTTSFASKAR